MLLALSKAQELIDQYMPGPFTIVLKAKDYLPREVQALDGTVSFRVSSDPVTKELTLTSLHQGVTVDQVKAATGWELKVAEEVETTPPPTGRELEVLRDLNERTARAHAGQA